MTTISCWVVFQATSNISVSFGFLVMMYLHIEGAISGVNISFTSICGFAEHPVNHTDTGISDAGISSDVTPAIISIEKHSIYASMIHDVILIAAWLHECSTKQNWMAWKLHVGLHNYLLSMCFIPPPSPIEAACCIPRILWCMISYGLRYEV